MPIFELYEGDTKWLNAPNSPSFSGIEKLMLEGTDTKIILKN